MELKNKQPNNSFLLIANSCSGSQSFNFAHVTKKLEDVVKERSTQAFSLTLAAASLN